jgi:hypothetical protein
MSQEPNDLIGRYVYQVGQRLPIKRRADVAQELASLINDRVEDELASGGDRGDIVRRVLKEMGDPAVVAGRYGYEPHLLIGVRSLPAFFKMVKVLPVVVAALVLVQFLLSLPGGRMDWGKTLLSYFASTLLNLGVLVVVFVFLEWLAKFRGKPAAAFDPAKLPRVPAEAESGKPSTWGMVVEIYGLAVVLVLVNFHPEWFGPLITVVGPHAFQVVPLGALGIHLPVPLFDAWLCALIVLKTEVLREGVWTRRTRWAQLALSGAGLAVLTITLLTSRFGEGNGPLGLASRGLMTFLVCLALLTVWKLGVALRRLSRSARQSIA